VERVENAHWRDQVREDYTERPPERPSEGRQNRKATGENRRGETVQNGHSRDQVMGESTERPLERPGDRIQYRTATGETR